MLMVIDVGNTNTVFGLYDGDQLAHHFRITTKRGSTGDEVGALIADLIERRGIALRDVHVGILASVVPQANRAIVEACTRYFGRAPIEVNHTIKTGIPILTDQPSEVGADRIVNAVASWNRYRCANIVVDFGTATTFDAISAQGEYLGGAIAPGLETGMDALFSRTAKLPRIELKRPPRVIGKNTVHALQSGWVFGYTGLVDEIVRRMQLEMGGNPKVVATGGLSHLFEGISQTIEVIDENLTLDGLRVLFDLNR